MSNSQTIPVTCPSCRKNFAAQVHHIVDVGAEPALKWQMLAGKLNMARCPSCGMAGILGMPFAYHDPDKELLFVFMPAEAGLKIEEQQKLIGQLTQEVMMNLPPEKRKGYLFQPRTFLMLESMFETILQADGITPEMMQEQQKQSALINELLQAMPASEGFEAAVEAHREELSYEFFQLLTGSAEASSESGDGEFADQLMALRAKLLDILAPEGTAPEMPALDLGSTREELLERLLAAQSDQEFETLTALGKPAIDYEFYLMIAQRIEAAEKAGDSAEAGRLNALRDRLLDLTAQLDAELDKAMKESGELLVRIVQSDEPARLIEEAGEQIDDLFFYVLTANLDRASQQTDERSQQLAGRLKEIATLAADAVERRMPPRMRLINQLLRAKDEGERTRVLAEQRTLVDAKLLELIDAMLPQFQNNGQERVVKRLVELRDWLGGQIPAATGS